MDELEILLVEAATYPRNMRSGRIFDHHLKVLEDKLKENEERLFERTHAAAHILQLLAPDDEFESITVKDTDQLRRELRRIDQNGHRSEDPMCRFLFVMAPTSRDKLKITSGMMKMFLSYHQVKIDFLNYLFPFGKQERPKDFYFSGFCQEYHFTEESRRLRIPKIGRSGYGFQLCYNLKSVEPPSLSSSPHSNWSIRQAGIYHSFDTSTGRTVWIIVKGNDRLKNRFERAAKDVKKQYLRAFDDARDAFRSALETHKILCEWSDEQWRWYLNSLEEKVENMTGKVKFATIDVPNHDSKPFLERSATMPAARSNNLIMKLRRAVTSSLGMVPEDVENAMPAALANSTEDPNEKPRVTISQDDITFNGLQRLQHIEETVISAELVLDANKRVILDLKEHYTTFFASGDVPEQILTEKKALIQFQQFLDGITHNADRHIWRIKALQRLVEGRKQLFHATLEQRSTNMNMQLVSKQQETAGQMHRITEDMQRVAEETRTETVHMRIITIVTLFFLPGTFISTLMSTDIIRFPTSESGVERRSYSSPALCLYLELALPVTAVTLFGAWQYSRRLNKLSERKQIDRSGTDDKLDGASL
ncbi:hypothetical protein P152DRAFT_483320 [Eremomyces bilateralis CBS 781.70]|uniref:CorA-like transporter domain-containing protein n=1 Tax=Eremomyces bilateralis CBS 781.70 TaxID=1392243 RepID=A0A6G1FYN9_9PEZI|nr:uncharacterized protein P152DRAFT_483320 [Eremomyces bilateralis CBS 781.70]KAF1810985.1 hypothetical protein P152DRAFT_483320 [Eremomyces bilateralis CBS 781.70]